MAHRVNTFKDHNGKVGREGVRVYNWMLDIGRGIPDIETKPEQREAEARRVLEIWSCGRHGTRLVLEGVRGTGLAKDCVILE